jgi:hypothetical protein
MINKSRDFALCELTYIRCELADPENVWERVKEIVKWESVGRVPPNYRCLSLQTNSKLQQRRGQKIFFSHF